MTERSGVAVRVVAVVLVGVAALAVGVARARPAAACSCIGPLTDAQALAQSQASFVGTLVAQDPDDPRSQVRRLRFDVTGVYKGTVLAEQTIVTSGSSASCGLTLEGGGSYLVFTSAVVSPSPVTREPALADGEQWAGLCGGTRAVTAATPPQLGAAAEPVPVAAVDPPSGDAAGPNAAGPNVAGPNVAGPNAAGPNVVVLTVAAFVLGGLLTGVIVGTIRRRGRVTGP